MNGAQLREKMRAGETVWGTMTSLVRNPRWAGVYGRLCFDFVIVDTEHSPTGRADAADLAAAFLGAGICPIVRVPTTEPHATIMALDAGFHGVLVPYCETPEEVKAVVHAARLRPLKGALHAQARDEGRFPSEETRRYLERRNANVVVIIGIESVPAVENLEKILDVGGIDVIFIGPNDLSVSLGVPDEYTHPKFVETVDHIIRTAQQRGIPAGGHWQTEEQIAYWLGKGSRFALFSSDVRALTEGYRATLNRLRGGAVQQMRHTL
jgi:2-keto-3-deoxy-L-rhamnonate aldolase RhmA